MNANTFALLLVACACLVALAQADPIDDIKNRLNNNNHMPSMPNVDLSNLHMHMPNMPDVSNMHMPNMPDVSNMHMPNMPSMPSFNSMDSSTQGYIDRFRRMIRRYMPSMSS